MKDLNHKYLLKMSLDLISLNNIRKNGNAFVSYRKINHLKTSSKIYKWCH